MQQPSASAPPRASAEGPSETVSRPDPGLARGKWEAPAWAFWVALALVLLAAALYAMRRMGMLQLKKKGPSGE